MSAPAARPALPDPEIAAGIDLQRWFPPADPTVWHSAAVAALKGKPFDKVMQLSLPGGVQVPALATAAPDPEALATSRLCRQGMWEACAEHVLGAPADDDSLAEAIADDLHRGAASVWLRDPAGQGWTAARLGGLLRAAPSSAFGLWLDGGATGTSGLDALDALGAARGPRAASLWGGVLIDPWASVLAGAADGPTIGHDAFAAAHLNPGARLLISGLPWAEAGAPAPLELAAVLGSALDSLRALADRGLQPAAIWPALRLQLGVGNDMVLQIAKLRALRRLWAKLGLALGLDPSASRVDVHARQLDMGLSAYDLHTNALRATVAGVAGVVGGADALSLRPYDAPLGAAGDRARRLVAHTHLLLAEEGQLAALDDLAGGAHSVEGLTTALSAAAWSELQTIETAGGLAAALRTGAPQAAVASAADALRAQADRRQLPLVGLSEFAWAGEVRPAARAQAVAPTPTHARPLLQPLRVGAAWESLRDTNETNNVTVFLACIGDPSRHAARAGFAEGVLIAAGMRPTRPATPWSGGPPAEGSPTEAERSAITALAAEARAAGAAAVVLCGDDADYARLVLPLLRALAPTPTLLAGRPGTDAETWRAAGLTDFLFIGAPLASTLTALQGRLGMHTAPTTEAR